MAIKAEKVYYTFDSDLILRSGAVANEVIDGWFALDVGAPLGATRKPTIDDVFLRHNGAELEIVDAWVS